MVDPTLYEQNDFVFLETGRPEQLLSPEELRQRLEALVSEHAEALPRDVAMQSDRPSQVAYLMECYCELSLSPDHAVQWYAVRLEKD